MALPFRINLDRRARMECIYGRIESSIIQMHQLRIILLPIDWQTSECPQGSTDNELIEKRGLSEWPRWPTSRLENNEWINERIRVICCDQHCTFGQPRASSLYIIKDRYSPPNEFCNDSGHHGGTFPSRLSPRARRPLRCRL